MSTAIFDDKAVFSRFTFDMDLLGTDCELKSQKG
jgi:hypothetical protein